MIAILAAMPLETELLRRRLAPCEVRDCGGFDLYRGRINGIPLALMHCGVGKANAAAAMTALLLLAPPSAVYVLGCAGAYPGSGLRVGDLALANAEIHGDEGVLTAHGFLDMRDLGLHLVQRGGQLYFNHFPCDETLLADARARLEPFCAERGRHLATGPFVTVSTCSGSGAGGAALAQRTAGLCENMEGAAVAQVCARHGLPFAELRGISNLVEDREPARWDLHAGAVIAQEALLVLLSAAPIPETSA